MMVPIKFITLSEFSIRLGRGIDPSLIQRGYLWRHNDVFYVTRNKPKLRYRPNTPIFDSLDPDPEEPSGDEGWIVGLQIDYPEPEVSWNFRAYHEGKKYIIQISFDVFKIFAGKFYRVSLSNRSIEEVEDESLYYSEDFMPLPSRLPSNLQDIVEEERPRAAYIHWESKYL